MSPMNFFLSKPTAPVNFERESSRLLTAAVINQRFRKMLLTNPGQALASGYGGEAFNLDRDVKDRVSSIRASSLEDFAKQLTQIQDIPSASLACFAGD